jgi:hypothetical protein
MYGSRYGCSVHPIVQCAVERHRFHYARLYQRRIVHTTIHPVAIGAPLGHRVIGYLIAFYISRCPSVMSSLHDINSPVGIVKTLRLQRPLAFHALHGPRLDDRNCKKCYVV